MDTKEEVTLLIFYDNTFSKNAQNINLILTLFKNNFSLKKQLQKIAAFLVKNYDVILAHQLLV